MFYRVANLPIKRVCIIENLERLVVTLKINPQKYNWPQKDINRFSGSNWSVIVMPIATSGNS